MLPAIRIPKARSTTGETGSVFVVEGEREAPTQRKRRANLLQFRQAQCPMSTSLRAEPGAKKIRGMCKEMQHDSRRAGAAIWQQSLGKLA
jgi:hypothetical protein